MKKGLTDERNIKSLLGCLVLGIALWFMPHPAGISDAGWHMFAVFVTTIVAIITKPLPMGASAMIAAVFCIVTNLLTSEQVFKAYSSDVVWLVVFALFIAKGFGDTGLGSRIAYFFTMIFGKRTLGLSYGLMFTDLIMSPAVPSVTGRSAGIVYPILRSIAESFGSHPNDPSSRRVGAFLTFTAYQVTVITSCMFMTAMAANPLITKLLNQQNIAMSWGQWALGACVPGVLCLLILPFVIYKLYPPELKDTPEAPRIAHEKLARMGPVSKHEWIMGGTIILLLLMWIFGKTHYGIDPTTAAAIGLSILLLSGVLRWTDLVKIDTAWETFIWFSILIMMTQGLKDYALIDWFSNTVKDWLSGTSWYYSFPVLCLIYFYSHYLFASSTAHVATMYVPFLLVAIALGTPTMLAVMLLMYFSNLFGCLTHYGLSPGPLLYGVGYVKVNDWWRLGFICSLITVTIFSVIGGAWWYLLGLWHF